MEKFKQTHQREKVRGKKKTAMDLGGGSNLYMPTATKISHRQNASPNALITIVPKTWHL